jgi:chromosome segregation ATPase
MDKYENHLDMWSKSENKVARIQALESKTVTVEHEIKQLQLQLEDHTDYLAQDFEKITFLQSTMCTKENLESYKAKANKLFVKHDKLHDVTESIMGRVNGILGIDRDRAGQIIGNLEQRIANLEKKMKSRTGNTPPTDYFEPEPSTVYVPPRRHNTGSPLYTPYCDTEKR